MKDATWFEQELLKRVMSYDPTHTDRAIAETIFREAMDAAKAEMRERCAKVAAKKTVRTKGVEVAAAIRALPLTKGGA